MIHQFRDKKQIAKKKELIRNLIIVGLFLFIFISGFLGWSTRFLNFIGLPIWKVSNTALNSAEGVGYLFRTKASIFNENEALKNENTNLKTSTLDYQILKNENTSLKELLGRIPPDYKFTLANILIKPNHSPYDTVIIDVGTNLGITEGEQVFANGNVPIGKISRVYSDNSLVILYSNPGQTTEATIEGSNTVVDLIGRGGGNFEMAVPVDLPSDNGTLVLFPNAQSEVVAIINGIISKPTDPVKKVILSSPINIQGLKWVEVKIN